MTRLRAGDIVGWAFEGSLQVGVVDSVSQQMAYVYPLAPHCRRRFLAKDPAELVLVAAGAEFGPRLADAARDAVRARLR